MHYIKNCFIFIVLISCSYALAISDGDETGDSITFNGFYVERNNIKVIPSKPTADDDIDIAVSWEMPQPCYDIQSSHTITDNNIRIDISQISTSDFCIDVVTPATITEDIGNLSTGDYIVLVYIILLYDFKNYSHNSLYL